MSKIWKKFMIWRNGLCERCKVEPMSNLSSSYCDDCILAIMKEDMSRRYK
jgi:hypothetical protein